MHFLNILKEATLDYINGIFVILADPSHITVDTIELHDALLKSTVIDYTAKTVEIKLEFYVSADDANRRPLSIIFEGVESIAQISNLDQLKKNAFAGNVNYWNPARNGETSYIYLADGCLAIKADKIRVKESMGSEVFPQPA